MSRQCSKLIILLYLIAFIKRISAIEGHEHDELPTVEIADAADGAGEALKCTVKGIVNQTWTGETYYAFRGIPYVQAPIGELRFKDPQPLQQLPAFIDARYDGHDCPSVYATNASEDCLTLNVYTKSLSPNASLPVLVFIHPGGLYVGSGLSSFVSAAYLLNKPLVLVTFNYRLGTLGFLQLGTAQIPGNAGFKDQVHALRWVQKYIHHFAGNPHDITIMGYSAGALSVQMHLVSPMSQALYHKAIIMSGVLPAQAQLTAATQKALIQKQLQLLNCTETFNATAMLACLNLFSGNEIAATLRGLFVFGHDNPIYLWLPIVEQDFGQARFLTADPYESFAAGNFAKVPILIGFTDGEFCKSAVSIVEDAQLTHEFYEKFDELAPHIFMYQSNAHNNASEALRRHYLHNSSVAQTDVAQLCDFFSDAVIRYGAQRFAELAAKHVKVFTYKFNYRGRYSNFNYDMAKPRAEHMDDLMYLFQMEPHYFAAPETDDKVVELYTHFMYDFMQNGQLQAATASHFPNAYALINTHLTYQTGTFFDAQTYALWKRLFS